MEPRCHGMRAPSMGPCAMARSRIGRIVARLAARRRVLGRWLRAAADWNRSYRRWSYVRSALWIVPLIAIAFVLVFAPLLRWLDGVLGWRATGLDIDGAQALYQTVI